MAKKLFKKNHMSMWASVITPQRAKALGEVIQKIERVSRNPVNRQVGNVVSDLKNLREFDLIADLEAEVEAYNQEVDEFNRKVDFKQAVSAKLKRYQKNERYYTAFDMTFPDGSIFHMAEDYRFDAYEAVRVFEYEYTRR